MSIKLSQEPPVSICRVEKCGNKFPTSTGLHGVTWQTTLISSPCCKNLTAHSFVKLIFWSQCLFIADTTRCCRTNEQLITHTSCSEVTSSAKLMGTEVVGYTTKIIFPHKHISYEILCLGYPFTFGPISCFTCRDIILSGNPGATLENSVLFHYPFHTVCEPQFHCMEAAGTCLLLSRMKPVAQKLFTYLYTVV